MSVGKPSMTFLGRNVYFLNLFIAIVKKRIETGGAYKDLYSCGLKNIQRVVSPRPPHSNLVPRFCLLPVSRSHLSLRRDG